MPKADGSILIETSVDVSNAEKDLAKLKKSVEKTETEIEDLQEKRRGAAEQRVFSAEELDAEKAKLEEIKKRLEEIRATAKDVSFSEGARAEAKAQIPAAQLEVSEQRQRVQMLQTEFNRLDQAVARYDSKIADATAKLERQQEEAGELAKELNSVSKASVRLADAQQKIERSMAKFGMRLRKIFRNALVFTLITQTLVKFREWMGKVIQTNAEASQAISRLKSALLTLAQPLVEVVIPALITFLNILTQIVSVAAQILSALFGKTASQSQDAAKGLYEQTEALEGVGGAAEDAEKSMASFDEINKLSGGSKAGGGGAEAATAPAFDLELDMSTDKLKEIMGIIGAIGAALLAWKLSDTFLGGLKMFAGLMVAIGGAILFVQGLWDAWGAECSALRCGLLFVSPKSNQKATQHLRC